MAAEKVEVAPNLANRLISPRNIVLVSCVGKDGEPNIITLGMVMTASHNPPMIAIGIRSDRYSHQLIEETGEFVVNLPTKELIEQTLKCGSLSGRDVKKFREAGLTPVPSKVVKPPLIGECVSNIECKVVEKVRPGTHTLFIGRIVAAHVEKGVFEKSLNLAKAPTLLYNFDEYRVPGRVIRKV